MKKALALIKPMPVVELKMVLLELYETMYGVHDHMRDTTRPLSTVGFHAAEEINKDSLLEQSMVNYIKKGIKELYGISYIEFLELPHDVVELMISVANVEMIEKNKAVSDIEKELR